MSTQIHFLGPLQHLQLVAARPTYHVKPPVQHCTPWPCWVSEARREWGPPGRSRPRLILQEATTIAAPRHDQAATDDAGDGTIAALAQRQARAPPVGARVGQASTVATSFLPSWPPITHISGCPSSSSTMAEQAL